MSKKIGNIALGVLLLANLAAFGLLGQRQELSGAMFEECTNNCCECMGHPGLPSFCADLPLPCGKRECENDSQCDGGGGS